MNEKPSRIFVRQTIHNEYTVRLSREITEADDFDDEFNVLSAAGRDDTIKFLIVSPGGRLDTCNLLTRAIRETEALTVASIGSECSSAATAIALACDEWEIDDNSSFMIHTASFGVVGKAPELEVEVAHRLRKIRRWVESTYAGFLSPEEIENVIGGKDYWFDGEELAERLGAYAEHRAAQHQRYEQEAQEWVDTEEDEA